MDITGNTVFIPGATSGIGLGLALRLHDSGNTVIIGGRRTGLMEQIAAEHPGIHTVVVDTSEPASIAAAQAAVLRAHPALNVLIPMAGIMHPEDLHRADHLEVAERTVTTNLLGPIRLIAAFVPHLARQHRAAIITVSSGLAFVPLPSTPTYSATKAAIHSFTESLRVQLADTPVEVIELVPPAVRTALMHQEDAETAMPLEAFLDEVMQLLDQEVAPEEILVEDVGFLRRAERNGTHRDVLKLLSNVR